MYEIDITSKEKEVAMKLGKATHAVLDRSVFKNIKIRRKDVLNRPQIGLDANGVTLQQGADVLTSTATITGHGNFVPITAVYRAINSIYASGAKPVGMTVSLTIPRKFEESTIKEWMKLIDKIGAQHEVDVLGGQTTISDGVIEAVLTINALGVQNSNEGKAKKFAQANQTILLANPIGLEGTIRLAEMKFEELNSRYTKTFISNGDAEHIDLSLKGVYEALKDKEELYLHDVAEGGIFGALWELSVRLNCGFDIDLKKIPMRQETIEFCEFYDLNPYMLVSGGCMLIVTSNPEEIIRSLEAGNIPVVAIGNVSSSNDKIIHNEDEIRYLEPSKGDQIYKVL